MAVFVDDMHAPFGRMKLSHMIADTHEELMAMAETIGVQARWLQHAGTPKEHFDVSMGKRAMALQHGAQAITWKDLARKVAQRKAEHA